MPLPTCARIFSIASLAKRAHGPVAFQPCNLAHKILDQLRAVRRMHHLGMELHRVELALVVGDDRDRRARRFRHAAKTIRQFRHTVAMAHPDVMLFADLPDILEQRAVIRHFDQGAAEFAMMAALDRAAELLRHGLFAVANAEYRYAGGQDRHRCGRRVGVEHGGWSSGQDHGLRLHLHEGGFGLLERHDLGVNALLADTPRDQLRHLGAEIDDQNLLMSGGHVGRRGRSLAVCCHGEEIRDGRRSRNPGTPSKPGL